MAGHCELVLVIGSRNSSNSNRLVQVAREHGAASHLIDHEGQVRDEWLEGVDDRSASPRARARPRSSCSASSASSASAATHDVEEFEVMQEDVRFMLPKTIRQAMAAAEA